MPCYLFTYHGYGTWMPDHEDGYIRRREGPLAPDATMANVYRAQQLEAVAVFDAASQRLLIEETLDACVKLALRSHYVATETTHVHTLLSWVDDRDPKRLRASVRNSLTRRLNGVQRKRWLSDGASHRRIVEDTHFRHLVDTYLPSHRGWRWSATEGWLDPIAGGSHPPEIPREERATSRKPRET